MRVRILCSITTIIVFLIVASCSKNNNGDLNEKKVLLISKKWELSGLKLKTDSGTVIEDAFTSLPAYRKDDYLLFSPDSTYEYNDNMILRIDSTSKILDAGRWYFIDGGRSIYMRSEIYSTTYNPPIILELSPTKLFLETHYPDGSVTWTTFKAQ